MATRPQGALLIVERSDDVRALLAAQLTAAGYMVAQVSTGADALAAAASLHPDVVLLDPELSDCDGLTVLDRLKADEETALAPVLVVTGDSRAGLQQALERGAHDHLTKPFRMDELLARVGAAMRVKREHDRLLETRETLRAAEGRLRACVDVIQEGIAVLDARRDDRGRIIDFEVVFANPAATALNPTIVGGATVARIVPDLAQACTGVVESGHPVQRRLGTDVDGERVTFEFNIARLDDGVVVAFSDITERQLAEERLAWAATHDALTGLANRPLLLDRIAHALARRRATPKTELAVLFIDLDGFKAVNDAFGHQAGDLVLSEVASRLRATVRPADTVARFGGDEFVVLAEELADGADARLLADRLAAAVTEASPDHPLLASVGIALAQAADTPDSLLRRADEAMYAEKRRRE